MESRRSGPGSSSRTWTAVVLLLAIGGCSSIREVRCGGDARFEVQDTLYFGTQKPGGDVDADEWAAFLRATVTPRFPKGLTVSEASGQWLGADGTLVRESTHVLLLVHPDDAASDRLITEIVSSYKARFRQEAVLRTRTGACVSY